MLSSDSHLLYHLSNNWASLVAQRVKCLPTMQETWVWFLGGEDPLEKEMVTHSSTLAWRIPWMWLIHVNVWQKPLQYCKIISLQLIKINGKKKKKIPWMEEPDGLQSMGSQKVGHDWATSSSNQGPHFIFPLYSLCFSFSKEPTHWRRPWCWERLKAKGEGSDRGWDDQTASQTQWTWVWANSRRE